MLPCVSLYFDYKNPRHLHKTCKFENSSINHYLPESLITIQANSQQIIDSNTKTSKTIYK